MPKIFRIGSYIIYFWSNENDPLEPVHVHIAEGRATANATKIWITSSGKALLCNNNSQIPQRTLNNMIRYIEANSGIIINKWYAQFGEIRYYCQANLGGNKTDRKNFFFRSVCFGKKEVQGVEDRPAFL